MTQEMLKWLRLVTPGIIIALFVAVIGYISQQWTPVWPQNLEEWSKSLCVIIPGLLYYLLPLRDKSNKCYFDEVVENLRSQMINVSGLKDDKDVFSWKAVRGIFYYLIDNDETLRTKSRLAYFNGWIWTTVADLRALSAVTFLILAVLYFFDFPLLNIGKLLTLFGAVYILTNWASRKVTRQHKEIGNEQMEIIEHFYKKDLRKKLDEVKNRHKP